MQSQMSTLVSFVSPGRGVIGSSPFLKGVYQSCMRVFEYVRMYTRVCVCVCVCVLARASVLFSSFSAVLSHWDFNQLANGPSAMLSVMK